MPDKRSNAIKNWVESDRPRERMRHLGPSAMSDAELIAILLGSGTRTHSALDLAKQILIENNNNLIELSRKTPSQLQRINGIGEARSMLLTAAMELGRRREQTEVPERLKIETSKDLYRLMKPKLAHLPHEEFWVAAINRASRIIATRRISAGGITETTADVRIMLQFVLEMQAPAMAVFHNHPSGNLRPSEADIKLTKKLSQAGAWMNIVLIDHLIIGERGYFSFADESML
ncbi:MAG: RadC family protein [Bacteroidia bacterium]|jgi:DNA repair protein RadC